MLNEKIPLSVASISLLNSITLKPDTGASRHFLKPDHASCLSKLTHIYNGPKALLPNNTMISPSSQGFLPFSELSKSATKALVYPNLKNESLLSIGQLCDDNCRAIFEKDIMYITKENKIILQGKRNQFDGLWDIILPSKVPSKITPHISPPSCNYIITKDKSKTILAQYLHATAFSPPLSTFDYAIKNGNFITWPGIDNLNFKKLIDTTTALEKGHMDQERKKLQSTQPDEDYFPPHTAVKNYELYAKIVNAHPTSTHLKEKAYSDLTGRFPHMSSRGNQYLFVLYDYDSNAILSRAIKSRQGKVIADAYTSCYKELTQHGHEVKLFVLDNECSNDLRLAITKNGTKYELVPPHQHRRNAAERAIRTYKNHLLAGLATCDPDFPIA